MRTKQISCIALTAAEKTNQRGSDRDQLRKEASLILKNKSVSPWTLNSFMDSTAATQM